MLKNKSRPCVASLKVIRLGFLTIIIIPEINVITNKKKKTAVKKKKYIQDSLLKGPKIIFCKLAIIYNK
jgi:hypothetical protein